MPKVQQTFDPIRLNIRWDYPVDAASRRVVHDWLVSLDHMAIEGICCAEYKRREGDDRRPSMVNTSENPTDVHQFCEETEEFLTDVRNPHYHLVGTFRTTKHLMAKLLKDRWGVSKDQLFVGLPRDENAYAYACKGDMFVWAKDRAYHDEHRRSIAILHAKAENVARKKPVKDVVYDYFATVPKKDLRGHNGVVRVVDFIMQTMHDRKARVDLRQVANLVRGVMWGDEVEERDNIRNQCIQMYTRGKLD